MEKEIFGHGRQRTEKETEENIMEKEKLLMGIEGSLRGLCGP